MSKSSCLKILHYVAIGLLLHLCSSKLGGMFFYHMAGYFCYQANHLGDNLLEYNSPM